MITQGVITAVLIGIVITGVVPAIIGIALLAMHKIKASSFWAGVLAYIIAMVVITIITLISAVAAADTVQNNPTLYGLIVNLISAVCFGLSMSVCIIACMKKTRTFIGALSCGLGFGIGYLLTTAFSLITMYINFVNVNSGAFDQQMAQVVKMGMYTKEDVVMIKEQFTSITTTDMISQTVSSAAFAVILTAAAVFVMRGVCAKSSLIGMAASVLVLSAGLVSAVIPNVVAALVVMAAIGAAALIFAVRMREQVTPPEKPAVQDDFLNSVAKAQSEAQSNE